MQKLTLKFFLFAVLALTFVACNDDGEDVKLPTQITALTISSPIVAVGIVNEASKTIDIPVPFGTDITNLVGTMTVSDGATVSPNLSAGVDFSGGAVTFKVTNGSDESSYSVTATPGENPLRLALVGDAASVDDLSEESKVAYQWAIDKYGNKAGYISLADLTADAVSSANIIWYHYITEPATDADGNPAPPQDANGDGIFQASEVMPANAVAQASVMADFVKSGKTIILSGTTATMVSAMGRIDEKYNPNNWWYNPGDAGENPDCWGFSYVDGIFNEGDYPADNASHYLFDGVMPTSYSFEGVTFDGICLSPAGVKKDRQNNWFFIPMFEDEVDGTVINAYKDKFQEVTNSIVRASTEWDVAANGIEFGLMVEFVPDGDFAGTILAIPGGAYEWHRIGGDGIMFNVEQITANAIDNFIDK